MTHSALALQATIYSALVNSQKMTELLGGEKIFDDIPNNEKPPYVVFGQSIHNDWSTGSESGMEHSITLNIWSEQNGRKEVLLLADALADALKNLPKNINGHALVNFTHEFTEVDREEESELFIARVNFRAVTEPIS
jgi:hypothetical protein